MKNLAWRVKRGGAAVAIIINECCDLYTCQWNKAAVKCCTIYCTGVLVVFLLCLTNVIRLVVYYDPL